MKKVASLLMFAMTASLLSADNLDLSGDHIMTVADGNTETISDKVTGAGRIILLGGGTLVLNNAENDFTGGIVISNGIVRADASGAFGTGPIMLEGTNALRQVQFNAAGGVVCQLHHAVYYRYCQ
jgi:autotransporter-associated beta strand protein